ncbi:MAG: phosphate ABC transporter permease, partial [Bacteroidetes bacterium HGW-Bacteroidetes-13]
MQVNKYQTEKIVKIALGIVTLLIVVVLFSIIAGIFIKGIPALTWDIVSQVPKGGYYFGKEGGILNAIIGSLYLAIGASLIACIISIP